VDAGASREQGGAAALVMRGRRDESVQGRLGADLAGSIESGGGLSITPRLTAAYVHEFEDQLQFFDAGFAATAGSIGTVPFLLPNSDRNWGEIGAAVRVGGDRFSVNLSAEATVARSDVRYQTYRVSANIKF
jgi:outer membrane autotransporter protein